MNRRSLKAITAAAVLAGLLLTARAAPMEPVQITALEQQAGQLVNQQRLGQGLQPLQLDPVLTRKARVKSRDMLQNRYFDHSSPTYGSPFAMMRALGIDYASAGENIAMGYSSPQQVVAAWMASENHRENLLSPHYDAMGIGEAGGCWTQWLIRRKQTGSVLPD